MHITKKKIILGKFGRVHGIHGWIKLFSFTKRKGDIFNYKNLFILKNQKNSFLIKFSNYIIKKNNYIVKINNINNRNKITEFVNCKIYILEAELILYKKPKEYYWYEIIGCKVININKVYLGYIIQIIETGANDVIVVKYQNLNKKIINKKILIPFIFKQVIKNIDLINKVIKVSWEL
ncbi:16S rRNA processing protein RimM [Enterobacteriaceae endosymbiont of Donacia tomentosa]|uniref:ribosome maturation factor RimM n=1 Tax=Enterobacteriaceae endosymbiont of Donacia tomentosa TaxID=2675787 RepID=UPI0014498899|nr:ribosome maturation factor RimM [Enterobacteriaceae endosymbiont of Donacia tomentosa]QJC31826.1 16S rRNA processing protein RimM [Enterobacteriaceae endosymbiont of Donacia tomentosa]